LASALVEQQRGMLCRHRTTPTSIAFVPRLCVPSPWSAVRRCRTAPTHCCVGSRQSRSSGQEKRARRSPDRVDRDGCVCRPARCCRIQSQLAPARLPEAMGREHRRAARRARHRQAPHPAVSLLASVLEERRQLRAQHGVEQRAREEALARRDQIDERIAELDGDALERVIRLVWTGWNPRLTELRDLIRRRRDALTPRRRTDLFATPPTPGLRRGLWVAGCGLAA